MILRTWVLSLLPIFLFVFYNFFVFLVTDLHFVFNALMFSRKSSHIFLYSFHNFSLLIFFIVLIFCCWKTKNSYNPIYFCKRKTYVLKVKLGVKTLRVQEGH